MPHAHGDLDHVHASQKVFALLLTRLRLTWREDMESCYPVPDYLVNILASVQPDSHLVKLALQVKTDYFRFVQDTFEKKSQHAWLKTPSHARLYYCSVVANAFDTGAL